VSSDCEYTEVAYREKCKREDQDKHVALAMDVISLLEEQHKTLSKEAVVFQLPGYASKWKKERNSIVPHFVLT